MSAPSQPPPPLLAHGQQSHPPQHAPPLQQHAGPNSQQLAQLLAQKKAQQQPSPPQVIYAPPLTALAGPSTGSMQADAAPSPEEDTPRPRGKKRSRARVHYSCTECHRRKQKCNREVPCQHCIARKVPHLCKTFMPGQDESDVNNRLARVENLLESLLPLLRDDKSPPAAKRRKTTEEPEEPEEPDELANVGIGPAATGTLHQSGNWYGPSSLNVEDTFDLVEKVGGKDATSQLQTHATQQSRSAAEQLARLVEECGVSPQTLVELVNDLPAKHIADGLVDSFFAHINWTRYPIDERAFRAAYENICRKRHAIEAVDVKYLPLVFIVLATTIRFAPGEEMTAAVGSVRGENQRRLWALKLYWSARRSALIATAVQGECLELVITRLLNTRLLINERKLTECWAQLGAAIRTAQSIGMHRDGAKLGLSAWETEYRRRLWSYLQHADSTLALILGRPACIIPAYTDTLPLSNVDDADFYDGSENAPPPVPKPLTTPTVMTAHVLRHTLVQIVARCNEHFLNLRAPSSYSNVLRLDSEIVSFLNSLPPHYRFDNPDRSLDASHSFLPTHRFLLHVECMFTRISLHRPWVLRKLNSSRFAPSRKACFESAKMDFEARQRLKREVSGNLARFGGGQYRIFNSTLISALALLLEPHGPDAEQYKHILDTFIADRQALPSFPGDEAVVNETRIIQLFRQKAEEAAKRTPQPVRRSDMDPPSRDEENSGDDASTERDPGLRFAQPDASTASANLLLGLSQSSAKSGSSSGAGAASPAPAASEPFANPPFPATSQPASSSQASLARLLSPSPASNPTPITLPPPLPPTAPLATSTASWYWPNAAPAPHSDPLTGSSQNDAVGFSGATASQWTAGGLGGPGHDAPADSIAMLLGLGVPEMMGNVNAGVGGHSVGNGIGGGTDDGASFWNQLISSLGSNS